MVERLVSTRSSRVGDDEYDWMSDAPCTQVDPETFFPKKDESSRDAERVCAGCPVREQCLALADALGDPEGIWGGLTRNQRLRRKAGHTVRSMSAAHRIITPCRGCGRPTRGTATSLSDAPGTLVRVRHGLCSSCAQESVRVAS